MVGDGGCDLSIKNHHHYLPRHLHKAYTAVVPSPIGDFPSPKASPNRSTAFSQLVRSFSIPVSLTASFPSSPGPPFASTASSSYFSAAAAAAAAAAFWASSSHPLRCSACIPKGTPELLFHIIRTTHSILSSVGNNSSTCNGSAYTGVFSPGGCTWQYRSTRYAVIRLRLTQAGGGVRSAAALYHPSSCARLPCGVVNGVLPNHLAGCPPTISSACLYGKSTKPPCNIKTARSIN